MRPNVGDTVFHSRLDLVGVVADFFDGVVRRYVDPNGNHLGSPVIVLEKGHSFVWREAEVFVLDDRECAYHAAVSKIVEHTVGQLRGIAAGQIPAQTARLILAATLRRAALDMAGEAA
jgi:hypothetical protein